MGAWKEDALSNDDAQDFITELLGSRRKWQEVERALQLATGEDYIELEEATRAAAAAEIVAAARGRAIEGFDEDLAEMGRSPQAEEH